MIYLKMNFANKSYQLVMRSDGRSTTDIREISVETGILPRTHGSALFTRGETQALVVTTLGSKSDEMIIDSMDEDYKKSYYLHYNFPPYCVGEVGRIGFTGRREIGHGNLAQRAIKPVLPDYDDFPYTVQNSFRNYGIKWLFINGIGMWRSAFFNERWCSI